MIQVCVEVVSGNVAGRSISVNYTTIDGAAQGTYLELIMIIYPVLSRFSVPIPRNPRVPFHRIIVGWFLYSPTLYEICKALHTSSMGSWTSQDISRVSHCRGIQSHCPSHPTVLGSQETYPRHVPSITLPLSIRSRSPRKPRDIPNMSRLSYSRWLHSHCPSHPGALGHPGTSQTCPDCPTSDGSNPHLRVPRSSGTSQTCPKCPTLDGSNPTVYLFRSPGKPRNIPDMSRVSHCRWLQSHCPSHPRVPGSPGTSQTHPKRPTIDGSSPTVHPIPESREA